MRIRILAVGRDRSSLYEPAVTEYLGRIRRVAPIELIELPPSRKGGAEAGRAKREEGEALLARTRASDWVVALDERGKLLDSEAFSEQIIQEAMNRGRDLAFLIGGAEGHSEEVLVRAQLRLSLSPLTLAHLLARLVLVEQIYRAFAIARGEPYHK